MSARLPLTEDVPYEEDVLRNPFSVRSWIRYLDWKAEAAPSVRYILFERALRELPGSFKLWHAYLGERHRQAKQYPPGHGVWEALNTAYDRALLYLHKMPRIWLDYQQVLIAQKRITTTRHVFDRALRSLPVTQHDRIWKPYLAWIQTVPVPETAIRVYQRYLKFRPADAEKFIDFLLSHKLFEEAAVQLQQCLNNPRFASASGKSRHQLWLQLCDLVSKNPTAALRGIDVDSVVRAGLRAMPDEAGRLWCALADFYIRSAHFDKCRDIFEEGIATCIRVQDFVQIWDSYVAFEDTLLNAQVESLESDPDADSTELDMHMARYEALVDRRPLLLNAVLLRQNPHNVREWHKRAKLHKEPAKIVDVYTTALRTVDPLQAHGKSFTLWCAFASLYERNGDDATARKIYERAVLSPQRTSEDLANIYCSYGEMELRLGQPQRCQTLLARATTPLPAGKRVFTANDKKSIAGEESLRGLHKVLKLWQFRVDIEESIGTLDSTRAIYERIFELRVATPQLVLNFARLLEEHKHFEASFAVYEKGVALFTWPFVADIWLMYLYRFIQRYGGRKLERARDLFEQAVEKVPQEEARIFYLMYARLEEEHSLARHALQVYERACKVVQESEQLAMYQIFIHRTSELYGVARTREVFDAAIQAVPEKIARTLALQYAEMERRMSEIDRARRIYHWASVLCPPNSDPEFWTKWHNFEVRHGNEDTFREMLRIKRSVATRYTTQSLGVNEMHAVAQRIDRATEKRVRAMEGAPRGDADILKEARANGGFIPGLGNIVGRGGHEGPRAVEEAGTMAMRMGGRGPQRGQPVTSSYMQSLEKQATQVQQANPDEIDIDDDAGGDGGDGGGGGGGDLTGTYEGASAATSAVAAAPAEDENLGAMERLKRRRAAAAGDQ